MLAVTALAALLSGVVPTAPALAGPPTYGSNGVFGISGQPPQWWATSFIPPGRYRVEQAHSMPPYQSAPGFWQRCNNFPCTGAYPSHIIATGSAPAEGSTFMEILPSDTAVNLYNVILTAS